jgi:uncharacterized protein (TIGR04255 family)
LVRLVDDLWREEFPKTVEQPFSPPVLPLGKAPVLSFQVHPLSPPIRLWSMTEDEAILVQIQHDRLLLNWRKLDDDDTYPRYKQLRHQFAGVWSQFTNYIAEHPDFGILQPSLAEVSFFNRVPMGSAVEIPTYVKPLNADWNLEGQHATAYQLERELADGPSGNQNIAFNFRPENEHMQLEISTRIEIDTTPGAGAGVLEALDVAHQIGVLTFDLVTTDSAHSEWGRRDASHG